MSEQDRTYEKIVAGAFFVAIFFILAIYSIQTPILGEDEGVYIPVAKQLADGNYPTYTFSGVPLAITPLLPLVMAGFLKIFGYSIAIAKLVVALFSFLTVVAVFLIFKDRLAGLLAATLVFSLFMFSHFSMIVYQEIPLAFLIAMIFLVFSRAGEDRKTYILLGILIGLALLMKASALIVAATLFFFALTDRSKLKYYLLSLTIAGIILLPLLAKNIMLYGNPIYSPFHYFFPDNYADPEFAKVAQELSGVIKTNVALLYRSLILSFIGQLAVLLFSISIVYIIIAKFTKEAGSRKLAIFSVLTLVLFSFAFATLKGIQEERYFSLIIPAIGVVVGTFASEFRVFSSNYIKSEFILLLAFSALCAFLLYQGAQTVIATSQIDRYPASYIEAFEWMKGNTADANIWTTYCGAAEVYSEKRCLWLVKEFPAIMTNMTDKDTHDVLKNKYNVTHVIVPNFLVAQHYAIPESRLFGVFTVSFVQKISSSDYFKLVFDNGETKVYELT